MSTEIDRGPGGHHLLELANATMTTVDRIDCRRDVLDDPGRASAASNFAIDCLVAAVACEPEPLRALLRRNAAAVVSP